MNDGTAVRNDATLLLGLDGLVVERVERAADGRRVVYVVTADETAAACPTCGVFAFRVKEYVSTSPRDLPWGRSGLRLVWRKRRWYCTERLCPRGSFTESVPVVPARARMTGRLRAWAGDVVVDGLSATVKAAGRLSGLSWATVMDAVRVQAAWLVEGGADPVEALGIDEVRRGRPKWRPGDRGSRDLARDAEPLGVSGVEPNAMQKSVFALWALVLGGR